MRGAIDEDKYVVVKMWSTDHVDPTGRGVNRILAVCLIDRMQDERFTGLKLLENEHIVGKAIFYCFEENNLGMVFDIKPFDTLQNVISDENIFGWPKRIEIALGLARFLKLCHDNKYLVRNISAGNVVIDQDFSPVIVDFSMILGENVGVDGIRIPAITPIDVYGYTDRNVIVTVMYRLFAELCVLDGFANICDQGTWTEKSDVHMFGVLLLEILMKFTSHELNLALKSKHEYFIDQRLRCMYEAELARAKDGVARCLFVNKHLKVHPEFRRDDGFELGWLAMSCVDPSRKKWPSMAEVVCELENLHIFNKDAVRPRSVPPIRNVSCEKQAKTSLRWKSCLCRTNDAVDR